MTWSVLQGDCVEEMAAMAADSTDAVVCDPPYDLTANKRGGSGAASVELDSPYGRSRIGAGAGGFMGHDWDATGVAFDPKTWEAALRVLKPGGYLLAFGSARTYHRIACAVEDAGFEIRDQIMWLYGSGFPKSLNVSLAIDKSKGAASTNLPNPVEDYEAKSAEAEQWDGWGTALKPAHEPIVVARKPLIGTVSANVLAHGTGALNIDGCRIGTTQEERDWIAKTARPNTSGEAHEGTVMNRPGTPTVNVHDAGRWPANVVLDEGAGAVLDAQSGERKGGGYPEQRGANSVYESPTKGGSDGPRSMGDSGGASRFFFSAKVGRLERDLGLEDFEAKALNWSSGEQSPGTFQGDGTDRFARNPHPTVKPIELMRWLIGLVTPPGGRVLDPFCGSGSTGIAAVLDGFNFHGIEKNSEYVAITKARIEKWEQYQGHKALVKNILRSAAAERGATKAGQIGLLD